MGQASTLPSFPQLYVVPLTCSPLGYATTTCLARRARLRVRSCPLSHLPDFTSCPEYPSFPPLDSPRAR